MIVSQQLSHIFGGKAEPGREQARHCGYYDEMVTLIRNLFGTALKTNDSLQFAVLTGCLRIAKESITGNLPMYFSQ